MEVITKRPIEVKSGADAKKENSGFFSKSSVAERKSERKEDQTQRKEKRETRRANRKAKYGARPLKQAQGIFKDHLPVVFKKQDGSGYQKPTPEGAMVDVPQENIAQVGSGIIIDKNDAGGKPVALEAGNAIVNYAANEVEEAKNELGNIGFYKKSDTVSEGEDSGKPMSNTIKWIIGGTLAAALLVGIVLIATRKK